jgi:hypothetical protein|nr:PqqD family protein [uncultured Acetatifactor sp.]
MIDINSVISKKQNLIESNFQDCIMLYDVEEGKYYVLNEMGSIIWSQLEEKQGKEIKAIIENIKLLFPQKIDSIERDAITFVESMLSKRIVYLRG